MSESKAPIFRMYQSRPIRFVGVRDLAGWRMKCYEIDARTGSHDADSSDQASNGATSRPVSGLDWSRYGPALANIESILPRPPLGADRAGVGFVIAHEIDTHRYLITCWWDNQNELFVRCSVGPTSHPGQWDFSGASFSFCVWDMEIMAFEREAWIDCALRGQPLKVDEYVRRLMPGAVH